MNWVAVISLAFAIWFTVNSIEFMAHKKRIPLVGNFILVVSLIIFAWSMGLFG